MSYFVWDKSLDVSVQAMNEQHQVLIGMMNALYDKNQAGTAKAELISDAEALYTYVVKHFSDEEGYMTSIGFPGLAAHQKLHANLLGDLRGFIDAFASGADACFSAQFATFLNFWLATHIRGIDTKYGDYARSVVA